MCHSSQTRCLEVAAVSVEATSSHRRRVQAFPAFRWVPRQELEAEFRLAATQPEELTERQVELPAVRPLAAMGALESLLSASEKALVAW